MSRTVETLPQEFLAKMRAQLGSGIDDYLESFTALLPTSIRLNPSKPSKAFENAPPIPWCPWGRLLDERPSFTADPLFHGGAYYVQEASSMYLWHVLAELVDPKQDQLVLDLSAAPGGKTTLLQSFLSRDSLIVANEIIPSRNKILRHNLTRWGADNVMVSQNDPGYFQALPNYFDLILVDAPCSGEGLFRKDPGAISEWSAAHVQHCALRQKRILGDVLQALKPGGLLIYSTCTYNEQENEDNIRWLIDSEGLEPVPIEPPEDFNLIPASFNLPGSHFYPHRVTGEGFFISVLRKPEQTGELHRRTSKKRTPRNKSKSIAVGQEWLHEPDRFHCFERVEHLIAMPIKFFPEYLSLSKRLHLTSTGLNLGKVYNGKLRPSPELALSTAVTHSLAEVELSRVQAQSLLSHRSIQNLKVDGTGWYLAKFEQLGLAWLNILKTGQIKNNYPTAWRILNPDKVIKS